jgi:hypothetical protein
MKRILLLLAITMVSLSCIGSVVTPLHHWQIEPAAGSDSVTILGSYFWNYTAIISYTEVESIADENDPESGKFGRRIRRVSSIADLSSDGSRFTSWNNSGDFSDIMAIDGNFIYTVLDSIDGPVYFAMSRIGNELIDINDLRTVNLTERLGKLIIKDIAVSGDYVFLSEKRQGGIICIDCTNPDKPRFKKFFRPAGDVYSRDYRFNSLAASDMIIYAVNSSDYLLYTIDFSNTFEPKIVSINNEYTINDLVYSNGYIYSSFLDEDDRGLAIFQCDSDGIPVLATTLSAPIPDSISQLETDGFYLYSLSDTSDITSGIMIFSILDPLGIYKIGSFNPRTYGGYSVSNNRLLVPSGLNTMTLYKLSDWVSAGGNN